MRRYPWLRQEFQDAQQEGELARHVALSAGASAEEAERSARAALGRYARAVLKQRKHELQGVREHRHDAPPGLTLTLEGMPDWAIRYGALALAGYTLQEAAPFLGMTWPMLGRRLQILRNKFLRECKKSAA